MKVSITFLCILCSVLPLAAAQESAPATGSDPNAVNPVDNGTSALLAEDPNDFSDDPNDLAEPVEDYDPFAGPQTDAEIAQSLIPAFIQACDELFSDYVTHKGLVKYAELRRHRRKLYHAYRYLNDVHPAHLMALEPNEKIAFWINAYNLCTLKLIVDHYPIVPKFYMIFYPDNSIMQISNAWTKQYFNIMGLEYNLDEIMHELLLERFKDPRICFALSYASMGGGRLSSQAYRPETLDEQLDRQVREYLASPYGYQLNRAEKVITLSNLFSVHRQVFLESEYAAVKRFRSYPDHERAWLNFLVSYLPRKDIEFIENTPCSIRMMRFDWTLDESR